MSGTRAGNARGEGYHAKRAAYVDATGLSPNALEVLLAVMAHERALGALPQSNQVREFLGVKDLQFRELVGGLWLELVERSPVNAQGAPRISASKCLRARPRAWQSLGFSKAVVS